MRIKNLIIAAAITSACGNPVGPSEFRVTSTNTDVTRKNWNWPVYISGPTGYGKQDPNYPPLGSQCPVSYEPVYNGHNFVCEDVNGNRQMPKEDGYR